MIEQSGYNGDCYFVETIMRVTDFDFDLPEELIAQHPPLKRGESRLLVASSPPDMVDTDFSHLLQYIQPGDLLVFNDTKVIKARLFGQKQSGGKIEVLIERVLDEHTALAHIRASKSPKENTRLLFEQGVEATVLGRQGELFMLDFSEQNVYTILENIGHMPLPPYITRTDTQDDGERYQTVYATHAGAVAAPTAGLHFSVELLQQLQDKGVSLAYVTLHVGAGTFQPVRVEDTKDHIMHSEWYSLPQQTVDAINGTHRRGNKVWAVGTTSLRCLEAAALSGELCAGSDQTDIFITPGFTFKVVDGLLTNFHLPRSTLLMLISAFAGMDFIRTVYQYAVAKKYRFFSYGDAMLLTRQERLCNQMKSA